MASDTRKQSLYFPEDMLSEIQREAVRQDRSISWIVQQSWRVARKDLAKYPSMNDYLPPLGKTPEELAAEDAEELKRRGG